jgi:hypothetical protein
VAARKYASRTLTIWPRLSLSRANAGDAIRRGGPLAIPVIGSAVYPDAIHGGDTFTGIGSAVECIGQSTETERLPHRIAAENRHAMDNSLTSQPGRAALPLACVSDLSELL